jgi:hypothetical protein
MKKIFMVLFLWASIAGAAEPPRPSKFPETFGDLSARVYVKQSSPGVWEYTIHNWDKCPVTYVNFFALAEGIKGKGPTGWQSPGETIGQFIRAPAPVESRDNQIEFIDLDGTGVLAGQSLGGFTLSGTAEPQKMRYMIVSMCFDPGQPINLDDFKRDPSKGGKAFFDSILGPGTIPPEETPTSGAVKP